MEKEYNEDCFAFKKNGQKCECHALVEINCKNCRFYKSRREVKRNPYYAICYDSPVEHNIVLKRKYINEDQVLWK